MPTYLTYLNFKFRVLYIYIYLFAEDILWNYTKRPNNDDKNLKNNFENLLYMQLKNTKRKIRNIETIEKKLANTKIVVTYLIILV